MPDLAVYQNIIFDLDGVLVDSNELKERIFSDQCLSHVGAKYLVQFRSFLASKGLTRFTILSRLLDYILLENPDSLIDIHYLVDEFSRLSLHLLLQARVPHRLDTLRLKCQHARWFVLTAAPGDDSIIFLQKKNFLEFFDGGIFGSPLSKYENYPKISPLLKQGPTLFLGDSYSDFEVSQYFKIDFCFVSSWSTCDRSSLLFNSPDIYHVASIDDLVCGQ